MRTTFFDIMDSSTKDMKVTIHLSDVDCNEQFPDRILSLSYPDFCLTIGRGSQSDENIEPAPENAWFSSRVMSRQHALLRADPYDQILTIQDDASMHGTFLNGDRVGKERVDLISGDILTFGTEVVRGEDTYQPLKVSIHYDWEEEVPEKETTTAAAKDTSASTSTPFRNKFTVDFSEEDFDSDFDDDVQIVREAARGQSVEFLSQVDASKTQLHPTNSNVRPLPVSALMTTASVPAETATTKVNLASGHSKASSIGDDGDDDDDSDVEHSPSSPYYTDDEDESEVQSDSFNDESDFVEEASKGDGHDVQPARVKVTSVFQSVQTTTARPNPADGVPTIPLDNIEREPSPSDAALARPRLAAPTVPPASKPASGILVPSPSSTHASALDPYYTPFDKYDKYDHDRIYYPSFNAQENSTSRPSHSFVNPYSYSQIGSSVCSMGALNTYPASTSTYPWDLWKSVPLPYAAAQQPRPMTRFGPPTCGLSTTTLSNPTMVGTVDQSSPSTTTSLSSDNLRGKKRKADEISDFSDEEAIDSTPDTTPSKTVSCDQTSPAPLLSSKATEISHASTDVVEMSGVERDSSLEVEEALEQADKFMKELQARVDQAQNEAVKDQHRINDEQSDRQAKDTESLLESEGRLRKKRKISPRESISGSSRVSITLKYTATALAGATVGVLGAVIGLASLPTDYFV